MDIIKTKKNKVIDLRKKKITPAVKIAVKEETEVVELPKEPALFQGGTFPCIDCKVLEAQEFNRCKACDTKHRQIVAQLNSRPKTTFEKVPPKLTYRKEVSNGVVVTVSTLEPLRMSH